MDTIFIEGLRVETIIGVFDWEREQKQTLILDLEMRHPLEQAAQTDNLKYTIDYFAVATRLQNLAENHSFLLLESFAEHICQLILEEFNALHVKLKINKPAAIKHAQGAGIVIERAKT